MEDNQPRYFVVADKDKAALINLMNKFLKQVNPTLGVGTENFKDIPDIKNGKKLCVFITVSKWENKAMDALDRASAITFSVKEVKPDEIKADLMESLGDKIKKGIAAVAVGTALAGSPSIQAQIKPDYAKTLDSIKNAKDLTSNEKRTAIKDLNQKRIQKRFEDDAKKFGFDTVEDYKAWQKERGKGEDQPAGDKNDMTFNTNAKCPAAKAKAKADKKQWSK
jgi:hypothetical protein